jgi:hypothetical protein
MVSVQKILFVVFLCLSLASCGIVNEDEVMVPAYICVPSFTFVTDTSNVQGANSQAFNDMWISDAGIVLGAIGTPALLPIQRSGPTEIRVDAGISNTGQDNSRLAYPFVASYVQVRDLRPGMIDTIKPVFKYLEGTGFKFIEDFDRITRTFEINPSYKEAGDTILAVNDKNSWRTNTYSGKLDFPATQNIFQIITAEQYVLTGGGAPAFIEIDYKSNLPLQVGYYYKEPGSSSPSLANPIIDAYVTSE